MGLPPSYPNDWAINREGGASWMGNVYYLTLIILVAVGLLLVYEGDLLDGLGCFLAAALGLLLRYWLDLRHRRSFAKAAAAHPRPS